MEKQRKMAMVGRVVSFAEAEEIDNVFYASLSGLERLKILMELRSMIRPGHTKMKKVAFKRHIHEQEEA